MPQIEQKVNTILAKKEHVFSEKTCSFLSLAFKAVV